MSQQSDAVETRGIVVGVDGSPQSREAAEWAAREAERLHTSLTLCHVVLTVAPEFRFEVHVTDLERQHADEIVETAAAHVHAARPDVEIHREVHYGQPGEALEDLARGATALVVGARGHGGFGALLLGSVSDHVLTHARCPVILVRGEAAREVGPIVLGVDENGSPAAAEYAFERAAAIGAPVIAVHVFPLPAPIPKVGFDANEQSRVLAHRYGRELAAALEPLMEKYPDVKVDQWPKPGSPGARLVEASQEARLVVVGAHARSEIAALLLGSVSRQVVHHAHCPVAVIRS